MKPIIPFALLGALLTVGPVNAVSTTPVGYYQYDGVAGGNFFVPGFVKSAAFAGVITGSGATSLSFAASSLIASEFDAGATYPTHYVEITSGPNTGVIVDIASNTDSEITLSDDITALGLTGSESVVVRPHLTVQEVLADGEGSFAAYTDSVTFYEKADGSATTYLFISPGVWSSDFGGTTDGNDRPIPPATGFILGLNAATSFTVTGEVKEGPTVVQLSSASPNIVGPTNPLVGESTQLDALGFQDMAAYTDAITLYVPGPLSIVDTYLPDGFGAMLDGSFSPSTAGIPHTSGGIVTAASGDTTVTLQSGVTVSE